jgi:hypothetical protein
MDFCIPITPIHPKLQPSSHQKLYQHLPWDLLKNPKTNKQRENKKQEKH